MLLCHSSEECCVLLLLLLDLFTILWCYMALHTRPYFNFSWYLSNTIHRLVWHSCYFSVLVRLRRCEVWSRRQQESSISKVYNLKFLTISSFYAALISIKSTFEILQLHLTLFVFFLPVCRMMCVTSLSQNQKSKAGLTVHIKHK